jgi:azurin
MNSTARTLIYSTAFAVGLAVSAALATAQAPRVVTLKATDDMKYDITSITAKPGEAITVKVMTIGKIPKFAMAHNFVLLKQGSNAKAFADAAMKAQATAHIPPALKGEVLASTALAGPGETVEVTFKAPTVPGKYEFICSFPGHYAAGMKGVLVVAGNKKT